jgi:hypothetical protein
VVVVDAKDLPPSDANECTSQSCVGWTGVYQPVGKGEKCATGLCDDKGVCQACLVDVHCPGGEYCYEGICASCSNGKQDGGETGVDCGGTKCGACKGKPCAKGSDCASGFCTDGVCCTDTCLTCFACNLPNSLGDCIPVAFGVPDPLVCTAGKACDGSGLCLGTAGASCVLPKDCLSGKCSGGKCI